MPFRLSNDGDLGNRVANLAGSQIVAAEPVTGGYTPALRLVIRLENGKSVFAKVGVTEQTANFLRREIRIYQTLAGPVIPRCLGWHDDGVRPILLLEDLSGANWPPPWRSGDVSRVQKALTELWASKLPDVPALADDTRLTAGWKPVAEDPVPFLSLGLVSAAWLRNALPSLLEVDGREVARGESLLQGDVRSDNICLIGNQAKLVERKAPRLAHAAPAIVSFPESGKGTNR